MVVGKGAEWKHVTIQEKDGDQPEKGGPTLKCSHCDKLFQGGATRIRAHLFGTRLGVAPCDKVQPEQLLDLKEDSARKAAAKQDKEKKRKLDEIGRACFERQAVRQTSISTAFSKQDKELTDSAVAQFFYANGISFNVARSPYFKRLVEALKCAPAGYRPSGVNPLRETLLEKETERIQHQLLPFTDSLQTTGCTVTSDGWSNVQNRPLLNFLQVTPKGNLFLKSEDTSSSTKTAAYIAETWTASINHVSFWRTCSDLFKRAYIAESFLCSRTLSGKLLFEKMLQI
jgi:hypothetical protein